MPNWCKNFLQVNGPDQDLVRFQRQAAPAAARGGHPSADTPEAFSFQRLVPLPERLQTLTGDDAGFDSPQQAWGCRSDACQSAQEETREGGVLYKFATPWSPPLTFLREVSRRWPTLVYALDYDEPMMAFRGMAHAANGRMQYSHFDY